MTRMCARAIREAAHRRLLKEVRRGAKDPVDEPITTPAYSPQSNDIAEAFVKTLKRDYVAGADLRDAESVLLQLPSWIEDYNTRAPHSALGMRSPAEFAMGYVWLPRRNPLRLFG